MSRVLRKRRLPEREKTGPKLSPVSNPGKNRGEQKRNSSPTVKSLKKLSQGGEKAKKKAEEDSEPEKTEKKFFKNKKPSSDIAPPVRLMKRAATGGKKAAAKNVDNKISKKKESLGYAVPLRQTTLSESFGHASLRNRLRPRKNAKDYRDASTDSVLLENSISPDKRKTYVLLENIDGKNTPRKQPVYKAVESREKSSEDKDSVYDFEFDRNDPGEKRPKDKRRKKTVKKTAPTRKKEAKVLAKVTDDDSKAGLAAPGAPKVAISARKLEPVIEETKNAEETDSGKATETQNSPTMETQNSPPMQIRNSPPIENPEEKSPKARICSVETLTGDRKVSFAPNLSFSRQSSAKFNPFRSTQSIFKPRSTLAVKDMMDHSLLNKSLSPIKGPVESFDPASPWRPPLPLAFSSVKQVVQSTPQVKRNFGRVTQGFRIEEKDENAENDENQGAKTSPVTILGSNKAPNPLGVRTSNADNIQASKIGRERKPLGIAAGYAENKVNSGFADRLYKSPKKNDKAITSLGSPGFKKRSNNRVGDLAEDLMPRKTDCGTEDAENSPPLGEEECKLLRQSNLNTFLNIDEMPESIRINTSHGIFGDSNSTPVVKNQTPRIQVLQNIDNCFGFEEDNSDAGVSPLRFDKKQTTPVKKMFQIIKGNGFGKEKSGAARISLGEIKNTLYPRKEKILDKGEDKKKTKKKTEAAGEAKKIITDKKTTRVLDPVQFSDTFDVLSESGTGEGADKSLGTEIALFADLEPVHFTKPPRWSYAKKRERKKYWSSDDEEGESGDDDLTDRDAPALKKRRLAKLNKVEEKKIDEWVKSVNETFQEIDEFDLVVEKLS